MKDHGEPVTYPYLFSRKGTEAACAGLGEGDTGYVTLEWQHLQSFKHLHSFKQ